MADATLTPEVLAELTYRMENRLTRQDEETFAALLVDWSPLLLAAAAKGIKEGCTNG